MINLNKILILILIYLNHVKPQNSGNTLSTYLKDCYSDPLLLNRNNLPPMTLDVMLDIIRKIEDDPNAIGDMRQISTAIVHMFRQDGIVYDPTATGTQYIVPFSPTGFPTYKNRLLLTKLIPSNYFNLQPDVLEAEEKCTLHFMLSNSILSHTRGDEEITCDNLSGTRSARMKVHTKTDDVEVFDINAPKDVLGKQIIGVSRCPIETGVVNTPAGDVSMGSLITGIATGLEEQNVLISDLVTVRFGLDNSTIVVNNRQAATLAGDIAETAIWQGMSRNQITVGSAGGWNHTYPRRYYFHNRNTDLELTDAEIRGGIDGIVLSELAPSYAGKFPEIKLSQVIDMYYTNNGLFHEQRFRACNRKSLIPDVASTSILTKESLGPAVALYHISHLTGTTNLRGIESFIDNTVAAFTRYIPSLQDLPCGNIADRIIRQRNNLILISDRIPTISYVVDNIDVGKFGSSITLLNPENGAVVVDKTFSPSKFYQDLSKSTPRTGQLNVVAVLKNLQDLILQHLKLENDQHYCGGNSTVSLFISDNIPLTREEIDEALRYVHWISRNAPDHQLVFASSRSGEEILRSFLQYPSVSFIPIDEASGIQSPENLKHLVEALKIVPRRITNPLCGSTWTDVDPGVTVFEDFVDANGVNIYRMLPNYFYENNPSRLLRIRSTEYGPISVCYSRSNTYPVRNATSGIVPADVVCESASVSGMVEISLANACERSNSINECPPLYLTVSSTTVPLNAHCKDKGCRFPNDVKYLVSAHELGCYSNGYTNDINIILLTSLLLIFRFM